MNASDVLPGTSTAWPIKILAVDDDLSLLKLYQVMMDRWSPQPQLTCAHSGAAAMDHLAQDCPDIVICDLHLEDMDGRELVRYLHASERHKAVNIIMVSGSTSIDDSRPTGLNEEVYVLGKPVDFQLLKNIVFSSTGCCN